MLSERGGGEREERIRGEADVHVLELFQAAGSLARYYSMPLQSGGSWGKKES